MEINLINILLKYKSKNIILKTNDLIYIYNIAAIN